MTAQDKVNIDRIVGFLYRNGYDHLPESILRDGIIRTIESNCYVIVEDRLGIAAMSWFDIVGWDAHVKRAIVREDVRNKGLIKYMITLAWQKFPFLKRMTFERLKKYPKRLPKIYELSDFFKGGSTNG